MSAVSVNTRPPDILAGGRSEVLMRHNATQRHNASLPNEKPKQHSTIRPAVSQEKNMQNVPKPTLSVNTNGSVSRSGVNEVHTSRLAPLHKTRYRSVKICVCQNKRCQARFEVTETFQSEKLCQECRKPATCVHMIKTTEKCEACKRIHGNFFMRTM